MTSHTPRLPKFAEYAPHGTVVGSHSRVRLKGTSHSTYSWVADASIDLTVPRPTPIIDRVSIAFRSEAYLQALGDHWTMLPHAMGTLACNADAHILQIDYLDAVNVAPLAFDVRNTPVLELSIGPSDLGDERLHLNRELDKALPLHRLNHSPGWRLNRANLFAECIEGGWNLPIPRDAGAFHFQEAYGVLTLIWDAYRVPEPHDATHVRFDTEVDEALRRYRAGGPATALLLSAAAMADTKSAFFAMLLASAAAQRRDQNTLRVLRVAHQRTLERGNIAFGTVACLITCNAALGEFERANALIPQLESLLRADRRLTESVEWISAHIRALLLRDRVQHISGASARERSHLQTPIAGVEAIAPPDDNDPLHEEITKPTRRAHQDTPHSLSPVEIARIASRIASAEFAAIERLSGDETFVRALEAFQNDDDQRAWEIARIAVQKNAGVNGDDIAAMLLRLVRLNLTDACVRRMLELLVEGNISDTNRSRAALLLAQHHNQVEEIAQALSVLDRALHAMPNDIALRIERAHILTEHQPASAIREWRKILESGQLEAWEAQRYRQELANLLKNTTQHDQLLDELRRLHHNDAGNAELTAQLASRLQERGAIDEAVAVRARHACNISRLRGYPSVALLVQAINGQRLPGVASAIACANVLHLAATIAVPAAWLHRAMLDLAEQFNDPLIVEYAIQSAVELNQPETAETLRRALNASAPAGGQPTPAAAATSPAPAPVLTEEGSPPAIDTALVDELTAAVTLHFPAVSTGSGDDELLYITQAIAQTRPAAQRAAMLARRATILLTRNEASASAQAWTGAMILQPDDPVILAGLTLARTQMGDHRAAASSLEHLAEVVATLPLNARRALPEFVLRLANLVPR